MYDSIEMELLLNRLRALADANRFRIVMMLMHRPLCVCELLQVLDISGGTLSNHLKILKNAQLVEQRKDGRWVEYAVKEEQVLDLLKRMESEVLDRSLLDADRKRISGITRDLCSKSL